MVMTLSTIFLLELLFNEQIHSELMGIRNNWKVKLEILSGFRKRYTIYCYETEGIVITFVKMAQ